MIEQGATGAAPPRRMRRARPRWLRAVGREPSRAPDAAGRVRAHPADDRAMRRSYFIVSSRAEGDELLSPPAVAALLVPICARMALMVLLARRFAIRRARATQIGSRGRLHVRLVAFFSRVASVPTSWW
jgi:two-component system nitrogen regulation sensor histidine kinase NtrY